MFDRFWIIFKEFLITHPQHIWMENVFIILTIIGILLSLYLSIKLLIKNKIKKRNSQRKRDSLYKQILILLKVKKNTTY